MKKSSAQKSISKIAKKHGVTKEEVHHEIQAAINHAMLSQDPQAAEFWQKLREKGVYPTPNNIIDILCNENTSGLVDAIFKQENSDLIIDKDEK